MKMFKITRMAGIKKSFAALALLSILFQVVAPTTAMALTSGPGQPEFSSFEPATTTDLVDLSSGDFTYNIPLLSVPGPNGGYPINLAYHSGIGMEEEASWVGLGWNVNVGAITRQLRGLPDDFDGENIKHTYKYKPNHTFGLTIPTANDKYLEAFGFPILADNPSEWTWQLYYNNFKGLGYRVSTAFPRDKSENIAGLDLTYDSQQGLQADASLSLEKKWTKGENEDGYFGLNFKGKLHLSSRQGIENFNFSSKISGKSSTYKTTSGKTRLFSGAGFGGNSALTFGINASVPQVSLPMKTTSFNLNVRIGNAGYEPTPTAPAFGGFYAKFPKNWEGFSSSTYLDNNGVVNNPAQGYLYTDNNPGNNSIKDFSRDNIPYSKKVPNLPSSSFTHDLYLQTGQGTSSMFRPYFNKVALLNAPSMVNKENGYTANIEVGVSKTPVTVVPSSVHVGLGFTRASGENYSGQWVDLGSNPDIDAYLKYDGYENTNPDYEPFYFQVYGDNAGVLPSDDQLTGFGEDEALRVQLVKDDDNNWLNRQFKADNSFITNTGVTPTSLTYANKTRNKRQKRSTYVQGVNNNDADLLATKYGPQIKYLDKVDGSPTYGQYVAKSFGNGGQMSEYKIVHADGMKYVYGLPSLNKSQIDNAFALKNSSSANYNTLALSITSANGIDVDVTGTYDEYLSKTENNNAYAHSWLLTSVQSNDYIDVTKDGPSDDDYGYWVKFNYQKTSNDYQWRIPYEGANVSVGLEYNSTPPFGKFSTDEFDDRGSYSYGKKEMHYLTSVETKTHIAVFKLSEREDALSAENELQGGRPSSIQTNHRSYRLDEIALYSKSSYIEGSSSNVPIKVVHFEYSYDLCPGVPNNSQNYSGTGEVNEKKGKLTLKKVWFTYQTSDRGSLSPYIFDYGDIDSESDNPSYDLHNMDRWGNYKDVSAYVAHNAGSSDNKYPFAVFPYTEQDNLLDNPAKWTLRKITLPTRAVMEIEYEQDDYAYVEGNQATRMFDIMGIGDDCPLLGSVDCISDGVHQFSDAGRTSSTEAFAYTEARVSGGGAEDDAKIYFKLETPVSTSLSTTEQAKEIQKYVSALKDKMVYFKVYSNLKDNLFDYVEGYAEIESDVSLCGLHSTGAVSGHFDLGFITLKQVPLNKPNVTGIKVNPFTLAAIEHLRVNRPEFIYSAVPNSNGIGAQMLNLINTITSAPQEIASAMFLFNKYAFEHNWGKKIKLNGASIIRLCDPDLSKKGGGIRVKKITLDDQWSNNAAGTPLNNSVYGQEYDYTLETSNGNTISSGVAYEPQIGGNESALRWPKQYTNSTLLGGSQHLFVETPVMENYYPGASVVYSRVKVRSIARIRAMSEDMSNTLAHSSLPSTIYEFYTPKDFPVIVDETDLSTDPAIVRPVIIPGVYSSFKKRKARSQGYSVVLNDMSGKLKSTTQLVEATGTEVSKQTYEYYTNQPYNASGPNALSNKVQVLNSDGTYQTAIIGQSHDIFIDNHEDYQKSKSRGLDANLDLYIAPPVPPLFFIMPLPTLSDVHTSMRTIVTTKVISRAGILKKVITKNDKSVIEEESIAFDIETGQPVLSKTSNEFKDPVYSFNYPGHWYYPALKGKYINTGLYLAEKPSVLFDMNSCGELDYSAFTGVTSDMFALGDQIYADCDGTSDDKIYTVFAKGAGYIKLIDDNGVPLGASVNVNSIKVLNSGYDNQQSQSVGAVTAMSANVPAYTASTYTATPTSYTVGSILDASAIEMSDDWHAIESKVNSSCGYTEQGLAFINFLNTVSSYSLTTFIGPGNAIKVYDHATNTTSYGYDHILSTDYSSYPGYDVWLTIIDNLDGTYTWKLYYKYLDAVHYFCQFTTGGSASFEIPLTIPPETCPCAGIDQEALVYSSSTCEGGGFLKWPECNIEERVIGDTTGMMLPEGCIPILITINSCYDLIDEEIIGNCGQNIEDIVNPYAIGAKGIWRPKHSYAFHTDRTQTDNIKTDGVYADFTQFPWTNPTSKSAKWIRSFTITKYSPYGFEIESMDAIENYSASLYGYKNSQVTAIGSNARYTELASDNFEDYPTDCADDHYRLQSKYLGYISSDYSHTGIKSLKIKNTDNEDVYVKRKITTNTCADLSIEADCGNAGGPFELAECNFIGKFGPFVDEKYVLSAWVKDDYGSSNTIDVLNYTNGVIKVDFLNSGGTSISSATYAASGNIIDGWQRIYGTFTIPSGTVDIKVIYKCSTGTSYFDDVRIHPADGNMVSYVYDPLTYKIVAELDKNNYGTFYNYNNEGHLTKVKKETAEGIKTVKEGRANPKVQ